MKRGALIAFAAGLGAALWLIWAIGFGAVATASARAGFTGLAVLCAYALVLLVVLAAAWLFLLPQDQRGPAKDFYLARLVRDSVGEISPFSPVGGMVAGARLMVLHGMAAGYAAASVAIDATTEAMAQVAFLAFGLFLGAAHLQHTAMSSRLVLFAIIALLVAGPGLAMAVPFQKRTARWAERLAARWFGEIKEGASFHDAIHAIYDAPMRLFVSSVLHLAAWIASGGGTFLAFSLIGAKMSLSDALALEALVCSLRSIAVFVPAALGVQELGYAMLAPLFGLPAEMGLAVSLLKRAREIVIGVPSLLYWQAMEARALRLAAAPSAGAAP